MEPGLHHVDGKEHLGGISISALLPAFCSVININSGRLGKNKIMVPIKSRAISAGLHSNRSDNSRNWEVLITVGFQGASDYATVGPGQWSVLGLL